MSHNYLESFEEKLSRIAHKIALANAPELATSTVDYLMNKDPLSPESFEEKLSRIAQRIASDRAQSSSQVANTVDFLMSEGTLDPKTQGASFKLDRYDLVWEGTPVDPQAADKNIRVLANVNLAERLGLRARQLDIAACLVSYDSSNLHIGKRLGIKEQTAKNHILEISEILDVPNRIGVAVKSLRTGLLHVFESNK